MKLAVPDNYSARLEASTENGGVNVDYPGVDAEPPRPRRQRAARIRRRADPRQDVEWRSAADEKVVGAR